MSDIIKKLNILVVFIISLSGCLFWVWSLENDVKALKETPVLTEHDKGWFTTTSFEGGTRGEPQDRMTEIVDNGFGPAKQASLDVKEEEGFCFITGVAGNFGSQEENSRVFVEGGVWHVLIEGDVAIRVSCAKLRKVNAK